MRSFLTPLVTLVLVFVLSSVRPNSSQEIKSMNVKRIRVASKWPMA